MKLLFGVLLFIIFLPIILFLRWATKNQCRQCGSEMCQWDGNPKNDFCSKGCN